MTAKGPYTPFAATANQLSYPTIIGGLANWQQNIISDNDDNGIDIGHFGGINVSRRAVVGRDCTLSQGATIGVSGQGAERGAPVIGDDVYIGPGARLFGAIRIGDNVKIGPNAVVHEDLPANAVAVLDPGFRIVSYRGNRRAPTAAMPVDRRRSASIG